MSEIARRPTELKPLSPELSPQVMVWAAELRAQFTALGMSISLFCRLHPIDKGTVSRYLNGKRVPADRWFLDKILTIRASTGTPVTDEVRAHLVELQMAALKVAHPHEYRVRKVSDALEIAVTSWKEAERYAQTLEHQLTERTRTLQDLSTETERLRATWDHDRTRYHEEITHLTQELDLARDRARRAEHRIQVLADLLDQLETQQPAQGEFAADITHVRLNLQAATALLAEALTLEQVVQAIINVGHTALAADHSAVALLDPNRAVLTLLSNGGIPELEGASGGEISLSRSSVMTMAVNSRRPVFAESPGQLRAQLMDAWGDEDEIDRIIEHSDERAWVGLPLLAAGRAVGALRFSFTRPQKVSQEEGVLLEAFAGQCALAVERATLFEREHHTAETLQRSLLPDSLPVVRGLVLAQRFRSGSRHVQVGGDWYDVFVLPNGRVATVVGDVMGKGVKAAAAMGRIRDTVRALALTNPPPGAVLTGLDRVLETTEEPEQIATLAYMVIEPGTGEGTLALAGYPPPLLLSPQGVPLLYEGEQGTPLGWPTNRRQFRFCVPPGHTAVFYSDGLVKNRKRGLDVGLAELCSVATEVPPEISGSPHMLLDFLMDRMLAGHEEDDDISVIAIHVPPPSPSSEKGNNQ
ncbi:PP2C family protein-serine/threonine phosphatase [Microtetraspora sp. AC03309]|uniref:PP2C family protein-serine/threonine phosphatase n=1 Tax=Microtetraspora sp. AC03309 TaxID=2779376 RepID=UPI001E472E49|nr:GAF domain-containing SpoIIE family protein phosphatase [Microtetraspora sp. AC03309]